MKCLEDGHLLGNNILVENVIRSITME